VMFPLFCSISACPCLPAADSVFPDTKINYNSTEKRALPPTLLCTCNRPISTPAAS
jgi:hypothetical protein